MRYTFLVRGINTYLYNIHICSGINTSIIHFVYTHFILITNFIKIPYVCKTSCFMKHLYNMKKTERKKSAHLYTSISLILM